MSSFDAELERLEQEILQVRISGLLTALVFAVVSWYFKNYIWFGINIVLILTWIVSLILYPRRRK